jgi:Bacterial Ig-like domain (group 1)/PKD domain
MVSRAVRGLAVMVLLVGAGCDKVPLTAPTESTIQLFANGSSVPLTGGVDLIATVTEAPGTPVQNGTVVTFTTTLGRIEPPEARTTNGRATVRLLADGRSGTATVTALSGGATAGELEIPVGAAAADNLVLRAEPNFVGASGGTVQLIATVRDEAGNGVAGAPVTFSATAGRLSSGSVTTTGNGEATASLTTDRTSEVTARAGGQEATITIDRQEAPTVAVTVAPASPIVDQPAVFTVTVTPAEGGTPIQSVSIDFGDGDEVQLGSSSTTASHVYRETDDFTVTVVVRDVAGQETRQVLVISVIDPPVVPPEEDPV